MLLWGSIDTGKLLQLLLLIIFYPIDIYQFQEFSSNVIGNWGVFDEKLVLFLRFANQQDYYPNEW